MRVTLGVVAAALLAVASGGCGDDPAPMLKLPGAEELIRPDTPGNNLLYNFEPTDVVETHGSTGGNFLVHFTRAGLNAVPDEDLDSSSIPDFVEEVADTYEEVLAHYQSLGFKAPLSDASVADNGGDGRFDVYLVDFNHTGDGAFKPEGCVDETCAGYMVQENDFEGYPYPSSTIGIRVLSSHEFFHGVQNAYDVAQNSIIKEGTATWATESFDPTLLDFESWVDGYLDNPDRSLDVPLPGPVDRFSYGAAIFFQFLEQEYGQGTVRALWDRCENGAFGVADPVWFEQLDALLTDEAGILFADAFVEFARYNLFTSSYSDPSRSYAKGGSYTPVKIEDVDAPYVDDKMRIFYASTQYYGVNPKDRAEMTAAVFSPDGDPQDTEGIAVLLAPLRATDFDPVVRLADIGAGSETVDTDGANKLVVAVVNTLQQGDSRRPALCIGSPEEVDTCRTSLVGEGGTGGAGGGGVGGGGGSPPAAPAAGEEDDEGCGCRVVGTPTPSAPLWALGSLLALALGRRRRAQRRGHR